MSEHLPTFYLIQFPCSCARMSALSSTWSGTRQSFP